MPDRSQEVFLGTDLQFDLISWGLLELSGYRYVLDDYDSLLRHWVDKDNSVVLSARLDPESRLYRVIGTACRASKLWTSTAPLPDRQLVSLLHLSFNHAPADALCALAKSGFVLNFPAAANIIRGSFPSHCIPCVQGGGIRIPATSTVVTDAAHDAAADTSETAIAKPSANDATATAADTAANASAEAPIPAVPAIIVSNTVTSLTLCLDVDDVAGKNPMDLTPDGIRYLLVARTKEMRYVHCVPLSSTSELPEALSQILDDYDRHGHVVSAVRADNAFLTDAILGICHEYGIFDVGACAPDEHNQNGVAERTIQTIDTAARKHMHTAAPSYPRNQWLHAYAYAVTVLNVMTATVYDASLSSFTAFRHSRPNFGIHPFLPFGTMVHARQDKTLLDKLDSRTFQGYYVGPSFHHYQCIDVFDPSTCTVKSRRSYWPTSTPLDLCIDESQVDDWTPDVTPNVEALSRVVRRKSAKDRAKEARATVKATAAELKAQNQATAAENKAARRLERDIIEREALERASNPGGYAQRFPNSKWYMPRRRSQALLTAIPTLDPVAVFDSDVSFIDVPYAVPTSNQLRRLFVLAAVTDLAKTDLHLPMDDVELLAPEFSSPDPHGWKAMTKHQHADKFLAAAKEEVDMLERMNCWSEIAAADVDTRFPILNSHFIFKTKRDSEGNILRWKCRLVANGNEEDEDGENWSPCVHAENVRLFLALSAVMDCEVSTFDITGAFISEPIPDDSDPIYVRLPVQYTNGKEVIVRLRMSLYGLREAPRWFYMGLRKTLEKIGFVQSSFDPCVYIRILPDGTRQFALVHVDDILLLSPSLVALAFFKESMQKRYELTGSDVATQFIGYKITRDRSAKRLTISQPGFARSIAKKLDLSDTVVLSPGFPLPTTVLPIDLSLVKPLRSIVGLLQFLTHTRIDIATDLNKLAKCMNAPTQYHYDAAINIAQYVASTPDYGISFQTSEDGVRLVAWADASFESENGGYSRSGITFSIGQDSGAFLAKSFTQWIRSLSTQESEIQALSEATRYVMYFRFILEEAGFPQDPTIIFEDNNAALAFARGQGDYDRTKHITRHFRYCFDRSADGNIDVVRIDTRDQRADQFTKTLSPSDHARATAINLNLP